MLDFLYYCHYSFKCFRFRLSFFFISFPWSTVNWYHFALFEACFNAFLRSVQMSLICPDGWGNTFRGLPEIQFIQGTWPAGTQTFVGPVWVSGASVSWHFCECLFRWLLFLESQDRAIGLREDTEDSSAAPQRARCLPVPLRPPECSAHKWQWP